MTEILTLLIVALFTYAAWTDRQVLVDEWTMLARELGL